MIFTVSNNGLVHKFTLLTLTLNNNQDVWMKVVYNKEEGRLCGIKSRIQIVWVTAEPQLLFLYDHYRFKDVACLRGC
jgi:hypothetical protein